MHLIEHYSSGTHLRFMNSFHIYIYIYIYTFKPWAETWRRIWGGPKIFSRPSTSFFRFSLSFPYVYYVKCRISPFPHKKNTQFFTLFMLSRTSNNTASQNIGGTNAWAVPPTSNFGGTVPPSPPQVSAPASPANIQWRQAQADCNSIGLIKSETAPHTLWWCRCS